MGTFARKKCRLSGTLHGDAGRRRVPIPESPIRVGAPANEPGCAVPGAVWWTDGLVQEGHHEWGGVVSAQR